MAVESGTGNLPKDIYGKIDILSAAILKLVCTEIQESAGENAMHPTAV